MYTRSVQMWRHVATFCSAIWYAVAHADHDAHPAGLIYTHLRRRDVWGAAFTPDEASKIVSLREYYAGKKVSLPWRGEGSGNGGDAA
ncbi:MAG TPA: hypothetical protein VKQ30_23270 [Ktedonobacterales bacterium]|nr:hypothetical protein [Ktedonobacterales bacterium]